MKQETSDKVLVCIVLHHPYTTFIYIFYICITYYITFYLTIYLYAVLVLVYAYIRQQTLQTWQEIQCERDMVWTYNIKMTQGHYSTPPMTFYRALHCVLLL